MKYLFLFLFCFNTYAASNTTYDVMNMGMVDKKSVNFNGVKISSTIGASATENIDLVMTDDSLFTGAVLSAPTSCGDDEFKLQVLMESTVVAQFIDWYILGGVSKELSYPAKIPTGLTLRLVYKNTCTVPVNVKVNYSLHKVLN